MSNEHKTLEEIKDVLDQHFSQYAIVGEASHFEDGTYLRNVDIVWRKGSEKAIIGLLGETVRDLQQERDDLNDYEYFNFNDNEDEDEDDI